MIRRIGILAGGVLLALAAIWAGTGGGIFAASPEAEGWIGSPIDQHAKLADADECFGSVDRREPSSDDSSKTLVMGWGWDVKAKGLPQVVLLVDVNDVIAGIAQPGISRSDVPKVMPEVTSNDTGWSGEVQGETDQMSAYALLSTDEACLLGRVK